MDDLLVRSISEENCIVVTNALLKYLASQGHKASLEKLEGRDISQNKQTIGKDRTEAVMSMPKPAPKKQVSYLGCTGYCRQWICDYAEQTQSLSDMAYATGLTAHDLVTWTPETTDFSVQLKEALVSDPDLGILICQKTLAWQLMRKMGFMVLFCFRNTVTSSNH